MFSQNQKVRLFNLGNTPLLSLRSSMNKDIRQNNRNSIIS